MLLSNRYLKSVTCGNPSWAEVALDFPLLVGQRREPGARSIDACQIDPLRRLLHRLHDVAAAILADGHLDARGDAEDLGEPDGNGIAGLERLRVFHSPMYIRAVYTSLKRNSRHRQTLWAP